jgi:ribosomal protein L37AE/L43A
MEDPRRELAETLRRLADQLEPSVTCGVCGEKAVFDRSLDVNLCSRCGAVQCSTGWMRAAS